jgi:hypothetical protein
MEENMRRLIAYAMSRLVTAAVIGALVSGVSVSARANVITEWDEKAIAATTPLANFGVGTTPYMAQRMMAMVHAAMFDAVNSIERRYRPYLVQLPAEHRLPWRLQLRRLPLQCCRPLIRILRLN